MLLVVVAKDNAHYYANGAPELLVSARCAQNLCSHGQLRKALYNLGEILPIRGIATHDTFDVVEIQFREFQDSAHVVGLELSHRHWANAGYLLDLGWVVFPCAC